MRILDAATAVFRERGYERSTIAAIAASAGVADETVYGHFGNKRTLLGQLVQRAVRGPEPRPVLEQVAVVAAGAVDTVWALTSPELHQLLRTVPGWSGHRYARWLADALAAQLLTG
jgi:AcrR family transcriptional regulator